MGGKDDTVIIKKYANRRLYDTGTSRYITLEDLCQMVRDNTDCRVEDAKSGEDITRSVLIQVIMEQESKGAGAFPVNFLKQVIQLYDDQLQAVLPSYLETAMHQFVENQSQMRNLMEQSVEDFNPMRIFEEVGKKQADMMNQAFDTMMSFNPLLGGGSNKTKK